jgi:hypothetical protein
VASSSPIEADHLMRRGQSSHRRRAGRYTSEKITTEWPLPAPHSSTRDRGFWRPRGAEPTPTTSPTGGPR